MGETSSSAKSKQAPEQPAACPDKSLQGLETKTIRIDPRRIKLLTKNARYMTPAQFGQLVENIRKDGCLTSVPLLVPWGADERGDIPEAISGNHRIQAAIAAGFLEIDAMLIVTPISDERKLAIQLSHNAIVGQDDPNILQDLYLGIGDVTLREYSGITDDAFKLSDPSTPGLALGAVGYEEMQILFLPADLAQFQAVMERLSKSKAGSRLTAFAHLADYDRFFETLIRTKTSLRAFNSAIALRLMADLAAERLDQLDKEAEQSATTPGQVGGT